MALVIRLVTLVDVQDDGPLVRGSDVGWSEYVPHGAGVRRMSVSARHEAVLADGRRVLLLDDRGWTSEWPLHIALGEGVPDIWAATSMEEIETTARAVVGPDEPFGGRSQEDMEADHWAHLATVLREQGVVVEAGALRRLPHEVVIGPRLRARIGRERGGLASP